MYEYKIHCESDSRISGRQNTLLHQTLKFNETRTP